jgi:hypothetical protein
MGIVWKLFKGSFVAGMGVRHCEFLILTLDGTGRLHFLHLWFPPPLEHSIVFLVTVRFENEHK